MHVVYALEASSDVLKAALASMTSLSSSLSFGHRNLPHFGSLSRLPGGLDKEHAT